MADDITIIEYKLLEHISLASVLFELTSQVQKGQILKVPNPQLKSQENLECC